MLPEPRTRSDREQQQRRRRRAAVLFPCLLLFALLAPTGRWVVAAVYGVMSILAGSLFLFDKKRAESAGRRISESTLLTIAFLGGWPGALVAGQLVRHKTRKLAFRLPLWLIVCLHLGFWVWRAWPGQTQ